MGRQACAASLQFAAGRDTHFIPARPEKVAAVFSSFRQPEDLANRELMAEQYDAEPAPRTNTTNPLYSPPNLKPMG